MSDWNNAAEAKTYQSRLIMKPAVLISSDERRPSPLAISLEKINHDYRFFHSRMPLAKRHRVFVLQRYDRFDVQVA